MKKGCIAAERGKKLSGQLRPDLLKTARPKQWAASKSRLAAGPPQARLPSPSRRERGKPQSGSGGGLVVCICDLQKRQPIANNQTARLDADDFLAFH